MKAEGLEEIEAGLPEDPTDALEQEIARRVVRDAREVLTRVAEEINDDNAARLFEKLEQASMSYAALVQNFGVGAEAQGHKGGSLSLIETAGGGLETFGAQAIQQVVSALKGFGVQPPKRVQRTRAHSSEISHLTSVLIDLRESGRRDLEPLAAKIEARIGELLDDASGAFEEEEEIDGIAHLLPTRVVGRFPAGEEGRGVIYPVGDGPDSGGGRAVDDLPPEGEEEGLDQRG